MTLRSPTKFVSLQCHSKPEQRGEGTDNKNTYKTKKIFSMMTTVKIPSAISYSFLLTSIFIVLPLVPRASVLYCSRAKLYREGKGYDTPNCPRLSYVSR